MNTRFFSPALISWQAPGSDPLPAPVPADISSQALAGLMEMANALLRSSEAMCKIQQQTARHALLCHEAALQKLRASCTLAGLLDIQSDLLRFDLQKAGHYWQQLAAVALQTQMELMTSASHAHDSEAGNSLKSTLNAFQTALPLVNGFFPSKPCAMA